MQVKPFTVWFTGLSGAGKSTLAQALSAYLTSLSLPHQLLDGDQVRQTLCRDLGFTKTDRDENVRRISTAAWEVNRKGGIAIVAAISPYRAARLLARQQCAHFVEVFVDCPLLTLQKRDPKGLYRRALAGEISNFSGVSDPYEAPEQPEVYLNSDSESADESLARVLFSLDAMGYLPAEGKDLSGC